MADASESNRARANQLNLQAGQRYIKIQAHRKVYGSPGQWLTRERAYDAEMEQHARNGIEFIEAALKLFPNDPQYLNTYALLVADGLGQKKLALEILEKAAQLDPDDIQIRQNIRSLKTPPAGCLIICLAAAALGYAFTRL